jgi:hypothetical protein
MRETKRIPRSPAACVCCISRTPSPCSSSRPVAPR